MANLKIERKMKKMEVLSVAAHRIESIDSTRLSGRSSVRRSLSKIQVIVTTQLPSSSDSLVENCFDKPKMVNALSKKK